MASTLLYWSAKNYGLAELRIATWEGSRKAWIETVNTMLEEEDLPPIPTEERRELPPGKSSVTAEEVHMRIQEAVKPKMMNRQSEEKNQWGLKLDSWLMTVHLAHTGD